MPETKYPLSAAYGIMPGFISARTGRHWIKRVPEGEDEDKVDHVGIILRYWEGLSILTQRPITIYPLTVTEQGGTLADFDALVAAGANSSDTNDVVQMLADETWGLNIIWAEYRAYQSEQ
jgi:hypothetical protein